MAGGGGVPFIKGISLSTFRREYYRRNGSGAIGGSLSVKMADFRFNEEKTYDTVEDIRRADHN